MSSLTRPLAGAHLSFRIPDVVEELRQEDAYVRSGRAGRTLVKAGPLVLTVTALRDGTEVGTHHAETPMTLHVLEGGLEYTLDGKKAKLGRADVLFFGPGHARDIRALGDTALLLTITRDASGDE